MWIFKKYIKFYLANISWIYIAFLYVYNFLKEKNDIPFYVNKKTDMVIDGFPRSGNTYALHAFQMMQNQKKLIAHHTHHISQIILTWFYRKPNIFIIRKPDDAIKSFLIRENYNSLDNLYRDYFFFYKTLKKYQKRLVIVNFNKVINNFENCVEQVNKKFNTNFYKKKLSKQDIKNIFKKIDLSTSTKKFSFRKKINKKNLVNFTARPINKRKQIKINIDKKNYWRKKSLKIYYEINSIISSKNKL